MARVKPKRLGIHIDMTPMSDLAWLLLTFFILTTNFRPQDTLTILPPATRSDLKLPEYDIMKISIDSTGKMFFSIDDYYKVKLLEKMGEKYGILFTKNEKDVFKTLPDFGLPIQSMKQYLNLTEQQRNSYNQPGFSTKDSIDSQLIDWVFQARKIADQEGKEVKLAINGDINLKYKDFKLILDGLQENNMNKFILITRTK